jgi:uncharacterized RDD family membrane protein YckC
MILLIIKRAIATFIDYLIIGSYAFILWAIFSNMSIPVLGPIEGQLIGLMSLTIPAFLYVYLTEKGRHKATLGKRILKIKLRTSTNESSIFIRNFLKFLPWELAHTGIHWLFYYENKGLQIPLWVWALMVSPQILVFGYFISLFFNKGERTIYDRLAKTSVH